MRYIATFVLSSALAAQGGPGGGPPPQPLPPMPVPAQNPITPQKAILGKLLFWEEQMSTNNRVACGTCHTFGEGGGDDRRVRQPGPDGVLNNADDVFASPGLRHSDANNDYSPSATFGLEPQVTGRASPSFLTAAWFPELFWDGRATSDFWDPDTNTLLIPAGGALENQALGPVLDSVEMAHDARTFASLTNKLAISKPMALATNLPADMAAAIANDTTYPDLFADAFGTPDITAQRIAYALATYQRTLAPDQTPYDAFVAGNPTALTPQQQMGLAGFMGPARCNLCHTSGLFSDTQFRNLGIRPIAEDNGRQGVTGLPQHGGRFKTPSLRNVGLRSNFMHNGQFTNLQQVIGFYINGGGPFPQNKDPLLQPLVPPPPPPAVNDLIDFLTNGLTDPRVAAGTPPFDRPTLRSQILPETGLQYGLFTLGSGFRVPIMLSEVPANVGNIDWKLGVHNAQGGAATTLVLSLAPANTTLNGVVVNVDLGAPLLVNGVLGGNAGVPGAGFGSFRIGIPNEPWMSGLTLFAQWFVWDTGVPVAATSRGAQVQFF